MSGVGWKDLRIKIYADGADRNGMLEMYKQPYISGFTTNPTLMRQAGVADYKTFALEMLQEIRDKPISFEVFADDFVNMERQALEIASWGDNVFVKIPVTNTSGVSMAPLVGRLSAAGVKLNVTAMFTLEQVDAMLAVLKPGTPAILSLFAGRIADAGQDPVPIMSDAVRRAKSKPDVEILWASPREILNLIQADACGCHIITMTNGLLSKLSGIGKSLTEFSLETVQMFHRDARVAGYQIEPSKAAAGAAE
jgi:transaldolase